jgi:hypothetical protein
MLELKRYHNIKNYQTVLGEPPEIRRQVSFERLKVRAEKQGRGLRLSWIARFCLSTALRCSARDKVLWTDLSKCVMVLILLTMVCHNNTNTEPECL